jgi:hypothetical protein
MGDIHSFYYKVPILFIQPTSTSMLQEAPGTTGYEKLEIIRYPFVYGIIAEIFFNKCSFEEQKQIIVNLEHLAMNS